MAPFKSSLAKTAKQLLGLRNTADLGLRGATQSTRFKEPPFSATGGTVSAGVAPGNGYRYHLFLEPGNLVVAKGGEVDVLVIAGGGGSGWDAAGGGGAGGLRTNTLPGNPLNITSTITMPAGTISVAVGDGGGRSTAPASPVAGETGSNGGNSSIGSPGDPYFVLASGGGGGGGGEDNGNGGLVVDPVVAADGEHGQVEHFLIQQPQTLIMVLVLLLPLQMENPVFKVMQVDME